MRDKDIEEIINSLRESFSNNRGCLVFEFEREFFEDGLRRQIKEYGEKKYQEGQEDEAVRHQKEDFDAYRMGVIEGENTLTPEHKKELEDTYEKGYVEGKHDGVSGQRMKLIDLIMNAEVEITPEREKMWGEQRDLINEYIFPSLKKSLIKELLRPPKITN